MTETTHSDQENAIDIHRIMQLLPHRFPFLLIDKLIDIDGANAGTGVKNVTINEPFFPGHFPNQPIMPGVLQVEAMAQTAGALVLHHLDLSATDGAVYFMAVDKCKFRRPVVPGDTLLLPVKQIANKRGVYKFSAQGIVNGKVHSEAEITAMMAPNKG